MTSISWDVCLLKLTEISCQVASWQSGKSMETRPTRQTELTTASKRGSLNCADSCDDFRLSIPSFFCETFSFRSVFCSNCASHEEADLNLPWTTWILGLSLSAPRDPYGIKHGSSLMASFSDSSQVCMTPLDLSVCKVLSSVLLS